MATGFSKADLARMTPGSGRYVDLKVIGDKEIARAFKRIGERSNEIVMEKLKRVAHSVKERAAAKYTSETGKTIDRMYVTTGLSSRGNPYASIVAVAGKDRMEINFELGTSKIKARPWFRSTFRDSKTAKDMRTEIDNAIRQVIEEESLL